MSDQVFFMSDGDVSIFWKESMERRKQGICFSHIASMITREYEGNKKIFLPFYVLLSK